MGTSLTAGFGLAAPERQAYPALLQAKIDSAGLGFHVVNAGVSGETSAGGLSRLDWLLRTAPSVFVLELGANDGLRGIDVEAMARNLRAILERVRNQYPDARLVVAGMEAPPNLGFEYTTEYRRVFPTLAEEMDAALVPFLLDGVAGHPELNQFDGIHPSADGHRRLAANVWEVLEPILLEIAAEERKPEPSAGA